MTGVSGARSGPVGVLLCRGAFLQVICTTRAGASACCSKSTKAAADAAAFIYNDLT